MDRIMGQDETLVNVKYEKEVDIETENRGS